MGKEREWCERVITIGISDAIFKKRIPFLMDMAKVLLIKLPTDFDPLEYMRKRGTGFLHNLVGYAQAMRSKNSGEYPSVGLGDGAVDIMNSYQIFANMNPFMPNPQTSQNLKELVDCMSEIIDITLDEEQLLPALQKRERLSQLLDSMIEYYRKLEKSLESETAE